MKCAKCNERVVRVEISLESGSVRVEYLCKKCGARMVGYVNFDEFEEEYEL